MAGPHTPSAWTWRCLAGNHEQMMVATLTTGMDPRWWVSNGGGQTLLSYGHPRTGPYDPSVVPEDHVRWLMSLPLLITDKHRLYVHAGVDPNVPLGAQDRRELTWKRYQFEDPRGHGDFHVIHGHEQYHDGPHTKGQRTMLDTFAWATGRLAVAVFDDDIPGPPIEYLVVQCEPMLSKDEIEEAS